MTMVSIRRLAVLIALGGLGISSAIAFPSVNLPPALAHQVEVADDIGGTLHIEPNDSPRAGESALTWIALTQRGGDPIPLRDCDCQLQIYRQPRTDNDDPLLTPELDPVTAEGADEIPGTTLTFPAAGAYDLVLTGTPAGDADFQPFELSFSVVVAPGTSRAQPESTTETEEDAPPAATPDRTDPDPDSPTSAVGRRLPRRRTSWLVLLLLGGGLVRRFIRTRR